MINEARKLSTKITKMVNWFLPARTLKESINQKECYLCEQVIYRKQPVCSSCEDDLPWNDHPCSLCAVPMPPLIGHFSSQDKTTHFQRICGACLRAKPHYEQCTSSFSYTFPVNALIGDFKYQGKRHLGKLMSYLLAQHLSKAIQSKQHPRPTLLVPVPLHNKRLRERGFNQADDICKDLSKHLCIPVDVNCIVRTTHTPPQATLNKKERQRNLTHAFEIKRPLDGEVIALVDDVITTGATVELLSKRLIDAGAKAVYVWSLARTPLEH